MAKVTLVGMHYSPWTQRAQWALDHHGIKHDFESYIPVVGEPGLRIRTRKLSGRVSVPVLITPHGAVWDSLGIARHADSIGKGEKLYDGHETAVALWTPLAESALDAARGLVLRAVNASPLAREESVTLPMPRFMKGPTAKFGTFMLGRKYDAYATDAEGEAKIAEVLERLRGGLKGGYVDGTFSLADIVMSGVVQAIKPVDDKWIRLEPGTREAWTRPALASRFADLVEWRDNLYEKHRAQSHA